MKKKHKLCFILSHLPQGGAEMQTINLIRGLNSSNLDITLLLYNSKDIFYKEIYELPINLIIRKEKGANKISRFIQNSLYIKTFLNKNKFDIIHTLLFHNGLLIRMMAPNEYNDKIVYSIRNDLQDTSKVLLFFEKILIRKSYVVTNSLKSKEQFIRLIGKKYQNKVSNIYNGFDISRFSNSSRPNYNSNLIMGNVGRLTKQKNQLQILRVLNKIKIQTSFHFYLIGDKKQNQGAEIYNFVKENKIDKLTTILDSKESIENFYRKFNIFILSSLYEGCPNVLFEAMLSKCLCIVSEGANSDNFILDGINGLVYDGSDDMLELKINEAISMLNDNPNSNIEMIENGHNYVVENFSIEKMVKSYTEIYNYIINGR